MRGCIERLILRHYADMTGKQFRAWRKRMRLTVREVGEAFGVSRATVTRWEADADALPRYVGLTCAAVSLNLSPLEG